MTQQTEAPDVAAILEALRAEVRAQRAAQGAGESGTALSAIERELHHAAEQLEIARVVSAHWPLEGRTLYERAWALVNKVVRRGLQWYINPIVEQQNAFNDASARALRLLIEAHAELREQAAELRRAIEQGGPGGHGDTGTGGHGAGKEHGSAEQPGDSAPPTAEFQAEVERAGRAEPPAPLPDLGLRAVAAPLAATMAVSAHWDLGGATALTRARALVQRTIRQYLRWLINPIVEQQNAYNAALAAAAPHLVAADVELRARVAALRRMRNAEW
jgi:hypothetical protein